MSNRSLTKNRKRLSGVDLLQNITPETVLPKPEMESGQSDIPKAPVRHEMPSGHQVEIDLDGHEISIEDPSGKVAVRIVLKDGCPVVELEGAKLQMRATEAVNVDCADFSVNASNDVYFNAGRELTIESTDELHFNSEMDIRLRANVIWLN